LRRIDCSPEVGTVTATWLIPPGNMPAQQVAQAVSYDQTILSERPQNLRRCVVTSSAVRDQLRLKKSLRSRCESTPTGQRIFGFSCRHWRLKGTARSRAAGGGFPGLCAGV
jgi:hypothetical protein